ncbi:MAG: putative metal-dependent hydrolase, partial [Acidobacteriota bacterium]|nr:putative metal-dependent hydrolase [Acidobacteriota bacterium]
RYPIGKFGIEGEITAPRRARWIEEIAEAPVRLRGAVEGLTESQLDTPYRPDGWTVRQVAHHLPDSHMNSYVRFRLAVTEDEPAVKPYQEAKWAELTDARTAPIEVSLALLEALHERWVLLLRSFGEAEFARAFRHPALGLQRLDGSLGLYAWHGRHHVAQIAALRSRMGWHGVQR